jgi:ABC-type transport system involved in multi-copper enzyme maturation permease subunit
MLRLVWKDAVAAGWFLLAGMPLYAVQVAGVASVPPALLAVTALFTAALAFGPIGIEEVQGTETLWCSLPVSRRQIVFARYAATACGIALGLGTSWGVARAATALVRIGPRQASEILGTDPYASLFAVFLLSAALFLPCYFRLGAGRGLMLFSLLVLGLLVSMSALGWLAVELAGGQEALRALREQDPTRIAAAREWLDRWGGVVSAGLVAGAVLLFGMSALLSAQLYSKKDC